MITGCNMRDNLDNVTWLSTYFSNKQVAWVRLVLTEVDREYQPIKVGMLLIDVNDERVNELVLVTKVIDKLYQTDVTFYRISGDAELESAYLEDTYLKDAPVESVHRNRNWWNQYELIGFTNVERLRALEMLHPFGLKGLNIA